MGETNTSSNKQKKKNNKLSKGQEETTEQIQGFETKIKALEIELSLKNESIDRLSEQYSLTQSNLQELTQKYEHEVHTTKYITKDMTRQYKGMQDDLLNKINIRERTIQSLRDSLEYQKRDYDSCLKAKNDELNEKMNLIGSLRIQTETLCIQFSKMLSDIMTQMKEKIQERSDHYSINALSIQTKMDEICLGFDI